MTARIAVDFDGTLTQENVAFWNGDDPDPDWDVIEWVNERYFAGDTVFVWTSRDETKRSQTERWLQEWDVRYHALVMDKLSADLYIDDKIATPEQAITLDDVNSTWGKLEGDD